MNAAKVPTDLGGGQHGHLGLVVTLAEYAAISATPYNRPAHPGAVLPLGPTQWETTMLRETYRGNLRLHRETQMVEQALLQQLMEALLENYLKTYKNNDTNNITTYLNIIVDKLLSTYGNATDEDVEQNETKLLKQ